MDSMKGERIFKMHGSRVNWQDHIKLLLHRSEFTSTYHMEIETFDALLSILRPLITLDVIKSNNSTSNEGPIYPELVMAVGLRWLGGGNMPDIRDWAGISSSSFYRIRDLFLDAVITAEALSIRWPESIVELRALAAGFQAKSSNEVFTHCVGALDGMLVKIFQPRGVPNPRSFFSGHYCCMGVNIQAVCDSRLRFIYFATAAPGGTPDISAYRNVSLFDLIAALPAGFHVVADAAYILSEQTVIPYTGADRHGVNDIVNFYISQLRIRIEMAFGRLTTKWRILRSPLEIDLCRVGLVMEVCARLHNFIITRQDPEGILHSVNRIEPVDEPRVRRGLGYIPSELEDDEDEQEATEGEELQPLISIPGTSMLRSGIRNFIAENELARPDHNLSRREREELGELVED
jgi:DDE superfamily endonuclease